VKNDWLVFHGSMLFQIAVSAVEQLKVDKFGTDRNALVSIVFAAASLEAFAHEIPAFAESALRTGQAGKDDRLQTLADLMNELEESRAQLKAKLALAKWILSGVPFDKGTAPYQDFSALVDLRNALMHVKSSVEVGIEGDRPVFRRPKVLETLQQKKLLASFPANSEDMTGASWTEAVSTPACARWACNTAAETAKAILSGLPPNEPAWQTIRSVYEESFKLRKG
jgi:hypothetical protein